MKATILDLRRRTSDVLDAVARNESVTILNRGKECAIIMPIGSHAGTRKAVAAEHRAFGIWAGGTDDSDGDSPAQQVRALRKGRRFDDH